MTATAFVLLAAGAARRFGSGKLDADLGGKSLALWATASVEAASVEAAGDRRFIVCPPQRPAFVDTLSGWSVITNARAARGIGTSIRAAVAELSAYDRIVLTLADMPFVPAELLRELGAGHGTIFTRHPDGRAGVPAAFDRDFFPHLAALPDDRGAASLARLGNAAVIEGVSAENLIDVDTHADLAKVAETLSR